MAEVTEIPAYSIKNAARKAKTRDTKLRKKITADGFFTRPGDELGRVHTQDAKTQDSVQNFAAKIGVGTDNLSSGTGYGFNPISRMRTMLEWIHRGSWVGGVAIDVRGDDMTRAGVELQGQLEPEQIAAMEEYATQQGLWNGINNTIKWGDLYGGALGVYLIDGQDLSTPLDMSKIGKGQFKGILTLDRWQVDPSLFDLVTEYGPHLGLPKFYRVSSDAPALRNTNIHYTRVFRIIGVELPYWQQLQENLWGISVLERLYDRMIAFDSATQGAAQLVYKSYLRTYKIKDYKETVASGGPAFENLVKYVNMMARFQSIEGITLMDMEDEFEEHGSTSFSGIAEALVQFGQQLAGALQIPLVRLFGQSPAGLNSTGESDLRTYYDGINQQQNKKLKMPVTIIYRLIAASLGIKLDDSFSIKFRPLWQLTEIEKADVASKIADSVTKVEEAGLVTQQTALKELRQSAAITGIWNNITDEDIEAANDELAPLPEEVEAYAAKAGLEGPGEDLTQIPGSVGNAKDRARTRDYRSAAGMGYYHDLPVVIETPAGTVRRGYNFVTTMPADYGYIRGVTGADGDQVDCWVGPSHASNKVFVIDQRNLDTGEFDEHKCMLGYYSKESALDDYVLGYSDGKGASRVMHITEFDMPGFKQWLAVGDKTKPIDEWINQVG